MDSWARNRLIGKRAWRVAQQLAPPSVLQFVGQFAGQFLVHFTGQFTWQFEKGSSLTVPAQPREAANRLLVWKDEHGELLSAHSIGILSGSCPMDAWLRAVPHWDEKWAWRVRLTEHQSCQAERRAARAISGHWDSPCASCLCPLDHPSCPILALMEAARASPALSVSYISSQ